MGIWYSTYIDSTKSMTSFGSIVVPYRSSKCLTLENNKGKLGLLSLPNTAAFLSPLDNAHEIHVAVDGHIYNTEALCSIVHLKNGEDTCKTITMLYEMYGPEGIYLLDGAFSLILVDKKKEMTLLYRSFLTGFPLYYVAKNNLLSVSTNPLDILHRHDIDDSLSMEQMSGFFSLNIHGWTDTVFKEISEVAYDEIVMISPKGVQSKKRSLDQVLIPQSHGNEQDIIQKYGQLVKNAVEKNIVLGKKYGIMLSSGMDSSALAALASRRLKEMGSELHAYSWSLPNYKTGDETEKIKALCVELDIKLTLLNGEEHAPFSKLDKLQLHWDIPFTNLYDPMITELYRIASLDGTDVLFNGHFGDNLFPSRDKVLSDILRDNRFDLLLSEWNVMVKDIGYLRSIKKIPALRGLMDYLLAFKNTSSSVPNVPEWLSNEAKESRIVAWKKNKNNGDKEHKQFFMALSKIATSSGIGRNITAQFGLERLEPYIDLPLLNYTLNLPAYMAYRKGEKKYFAREAMRGILPEFICRQTKFNVGNLGKFAHKSFMKNKSEVRERLFDERDPWKVYVDEKWMERKFKNNAEVTGQDLIVFWMSLHIAPWQRAIKPGGSLYGQNNGCV